MKYVELIDVAEIASGQAAPKETEMGKIGFPFIRAGHLSELISSNNIDSLPKIDSDLAKQKKLKLIPPNTILFAKSGMSATLNKVYRLQKDAYYVSHLAAIIPSIKVEPIYLQYFLSWYKPSRLILDSAYPSIKLSDIGKIQIPLPPVPEQKRIAEILDKADALRQKNKQLLAAYDELLQATFLDMFGDPVINRKRWEKKLLSDVSEVVSGVTKGRKLKQENLITLPYIRVANVQDGHLVLDEIKTIEVLPDDLKKYRLVSGDILLTEGGDPDKLGRGAVWHGKIENCIHQNHIFRVRIKDNNIDECYLSALIGSIYGKKYFLRAAKQTTGIASINSTQLKKFPVIMAPLQIQKNYKLAVENIEAQKALVKQSLQESEDLFNGLEQKAFKGELN